MYVVRNNHYICSLFPKLEKMKSRLLILSAVLAIADLIKLQICLVKQEGGSALPDDGQLHGVAPEQNGL